MKVFLEIIHADSTIMPIFLKLCKGLRKHLLWELNHQFKPTIERFRKTYAGVFEYRSHYLWANQITYGNRQGLRVDLAIKFVVKRPCAGSTIQIGCIGDRWESNSKHFK